MLELLLKAIHTDIARPDGTADGRRRIAADRSESGTEQPAEENSR